MPVDYIDTYLVSTNHLSTVLDGATEKNTSGRLMAHYIRSLSHTNSKSVMNTGQIFEHACEYRLSILSNKPVTILNLQN